MKIPTPWRNALIVLVLLNVLLWAWTQGYLRLIGLGPETLQEPQRLQEQVNPDGLTLRQGQPQPQKPTTQD